MQDAWRVSPVVAQGHETGLRWVRLIRHGGHIALSGGLLRAAASFMN